MRHAAKSFIAAVAMVVCLSVPVAAGPYEDGRAAYNRGDYATALRLLRPLAEQGNAVAQYDIGYMNSEGQGVAQDHAEAAKWYRLAADQGDTAAQVALGVMYSEGQGVAQDNVMAHMWFSIAAAQGDEWATKFRDEIASDLTPADISKAQGLAQEWKRVPERSIRGRLLDSLFDLLP